VALLTAGQSQALSELRWIGRVTGGRITVDHTEDRNEDGTPLLAVWLTIDCRGSGPTSPRGRELGDRQTLLIEIPAEFPYRAPAVSAPDERFARLPYVIWQRHICLYASPNDWDPSAGLAGFLDRLLTWLIRASGGRLTGPAVPWHPPVTARQSPLKPLVVAADVPSEQENDPALWVRWARVDLIGENHFELRTWLAGPAAGHPEEDGNRFVAPVVALAHPVGFEFPSRMAELLHLLAAYGLSRHDCHDLLRQAVAVNGPLPPVLLIVGSPAPAGTTTAARVAHLAAWDLGFGGEDADAVAESAWDDFDVLWLTVYDQRPAVTVRRDVSRPVSWLAGKRVLLLGCGALGAPIAEHCVRAAVDELFLVDNGDVQPGILVRQPYEYLDIGRYKAEALADRLQGVAPAATLAVSCDDAVHLGPDVLAGYDLVVDASANRAVAERLEFLRREVRDTCPPIVTTAVGHRCEHAVATVALRTSSGAGVDALRRLTLAALDNDGLDGYLEDFYPAQPRTEVFQPEPGCSDPTFVGSSADLGAYAGQLLNATLAVITAAADGDTIGPQNATRAAVVLEQVAVAGAGPVARYFHWRSDAVLQDEMTGYEIRVDPAAFAAMRRESIRARELDHGDREAGGVLLGQIDPACRVVWVTRALGQGIDDEASNAHLRLDVDAIRGRLARIAGRSRGLLAFVGAWHSHPGGPAQPSLDDHDTMQSAVAGAHAARGALSLILGGDDRTWDGWLDGRCRPDVHVRMYFS
jgi:integrative and conjugative element protein (TIGR02256 family)